MMVPEEWKLLQERIHVLMNRVIDMSNTPIMEFDDPVEAVYVFSAVSYMLPDLVIREFRSKICVFNDVRRHLCQLLACFLENDFAFAKRQISDLVEDLERRGHEPVDVMTACSKAYKSGISVRS